MLDRVADVDLGRHVEDHLGYGGGEHRGDGVGITDVDLLEPGTTLDRLAEVGPLPSGQVVDHRDPVAPRDECVGEV